MQEESNVRLSKKVANLRARQTEKDYLSIRKFKNIERGGPNVPAARLVIEEKAGHILEMIRHGGFHRRTFPADWMRMGEVYGEGIASARRHRPSPWRNTSPLLRAVFFHKALYLQGGVYFVTVNFSEPRQSMARRRGNLGWKHLRASLDQHLRRTLGFRQSYWLVLEQAPDGKLHVHGAVQAQGLEQATLRRALQGAAGRVVSSRAARAVKISIDKLGDVRAFYAVKDLLPLNRAPLGVTLTRTNDIGQLARRCYERERAVLLELYRKGLWGEVMTAALNRKPRSRSDGA
jgi:hypothetical protein